MSVLENKLVPVDYDGNGITDLGFLLPIFPPSLSGTITAQRANWLLSNNPLDPFIAQGDVGNPFPYANGNFSVLGDGFIPGFAGPVNFFFNGPAPLFPDFNGDGKTDEIFGSLIYADSFDDSTFLGYEFATWFMDGVTPIFQESVRTPSGELIILPEEWADPFLYSIGGQGPLGDYNGDGKSDFLFVQKSAGNLDIALWLMDGNVAVNQDVLATLPDTWSVVNTNDFDGNGTTDLVLTEVGGGGELSIAVWLLDGFNFVGQSVIATIDQPGWFIADSNDFDGDGNADLILGRDDGNNLDIALWTLDGTTITGQKLLGSIPSSEGWDLVDHNDFNGDGKADLLFSRITQTGPELAVWLVDGVNNLIAQQSYGVIPDFNWNFLGSGDADGDDIADIVLFNDLSKEVVIWYLGSNGLPKAQEVVGTYDDPLSPVGWQPPFIQPIFDIPPFPQTLTV